MDQTLAHLDSLIEKDMAEIIGDSQATQPGLIANPHCPGCDGDHHGKEAAVPDHGKAMEASEKETIEKQMAELQQKLATLQARQQMAKPMNEAPPQASHEMAHQQKAPVDGNDAKRAAPPVDEYLSFDSVRHHGKNADQILVEREAMRLQASAPAPAPAPAGDAKQPLATPAAEAKPPAEAGNAKQPLATPAAEAKPPAEAGNAKQPLATPAAEAKPPAAAGDAKQPLATPAAEANPPAAAGDAKQPLATPAAEAKQLATEQTLPDQKTDVKLAVDAPKIPADQQQQLPSTAATHAITMAELQAMGWQLPTSCRPQAEQHGETAQSPADAKQPAAPAPKPSPVAPAADAQPAQEAPLVKQEKMEATDPPVDPKAYSRRAAANLIGRLRKNPDRVQSQPSLQNMLFDEAKKSELITLYSVKMTVIWRKLGRALWCRKSEATCSWLGRGPFASPRSKCRITMGKTLSLS